MCPLESKGAASRHLAGGPAHFLIVPAPEFSHLESSRLRVSWVDFDGEEVPYRSFNPTAQPMKSFPGHLWRVRIGRRLVKEFAVPSE